MRNYLFWIGLYNLVGALVMMAMLSERCADLLLRRATEIITTRYTHGEYGKLWLWWASTTNAFLGGVMCCAVAWPQEAQQQVIVGSMGVYALMYGALVIGGRAPRYGRGVVVAHVLWLAQLGWGGYALLA